MIWLLDLIEDHRAAVKYDLIAHGYRLEWLATERLPWGDAVTVLSMQQPARSAVYRETHPKEFDRTPELDVLEMLAVIMVQNQRLLGNQAGVEPSDIPRRYADLFERAAVVEEFSEPRELLTFAEIDALMGPNWNPN